MDLIQLENLNNDFKFFIDNMPDYVKQNYFIRRYDIGTIIHTKETCLDFFGILVVGKTRVINEFENGNIFMLETNDAIDYIGDVTILANQVTASVTIEAAAESVVFCVPRKYAEQWLFSNITVLAKVSARVAFKLYRKSIDMGMRSFYPSEFIFIDYLIKVGSETITPTQPCYKINQTRVAISEELGMNIKTLNRVITKLKGKNLFGLDKGKLVLSHDNFINAKEYLETYKSN